ncbi:MAG: DoxX family membrane protein [Flavobacteriales bacterium]|nr:DoxX family membrane protein [Flavobacteriia bacterium]NCP51844.1 DoxX family membrane protein [Flavobacteriales bacterium]PIV94776.1 MAG: DoxX family protein [Flavobacteriaceae bacterium CG17_big_fil_post_rev_8_21_14_2_50_33_15]PIY12259.1 MAG: DoxX family protein [Flavobacteriaceae bacterium CG_4_10_14_3_um_filter_33_47]PJB16506.1 MAG: DoxX family protein [Flavobacteriaceae bacterium CG_4_9_14_3_um_filter_33_16]
MNKALTVIRIIFGILLAVFGANKFFNFMPAPEEMPEAVINYMTALMSTKTLGLVGAVELIAGLSFIFNKYGALMAIILMSVSINAVLFHVFLSPADMIGAIVLLALNIVMLYAYKDKYKNLLAG